MIMLLFFFVSLSAQDASDSFIRANALYQKNECAAALKIYDQIASKGAATWYNMGNCAYMLNDHIHALLYWKRAYKYGNTLIQHESIENMKKLSFPYAPLPHPYSNIPPGLMQILFFCIFGVFLIVGYFLIQAKRWIFLAMSFSVLVSAGRITHEVYSASQQALIMQDTDIKAGPEAHYHQLKTVRAGTTVKLVKQKAEWSQILVDGMRGWVENKHLEKI